MLLKDCLPFLLYEFKNEKDLTKAIEELSLKFTTQREDISDYLKDERLVSAYTAFYLTTNIPKLLEVFKWMPQDWLSELKKCDLVDLGAGPGTFSLAYKEWGGSGQVHQIELSKFMREQAKKLWEGLHPDEVLTQSSTGTLNPGSFLLFGHSANEMGVERSLKYIKEIAPDHILFIEPGTKDFFPKMLDIRRELLDSGFNVLYPCPGSMECPMRGSEIDWCHQFINVQHSADVERLSQLVKKDRRLLPLTVHAYSKTFKHHDAERIVRVHPPTKFSLEWDVCLGETLSHYQVFRRGLDKKAQWDLEGVLAGASLVSEADKTLENGKRVKVIKINNKIMGP